VRQHPDASSAPTASGASSGSGRAASTPTPKKFRQDEQDAQDYLNQENVLPSSNGGIKPLNSVSTIPGKISIIRQYLPKSRPLDNVTEQELRNIAHRLNHRPRKTLGFKTPYELFFKQTSRLTVALAG
jgi:hypothetical protein